MSNYTHVLGLDLGTNSIGFAVRDLRIDYINDNESLNYSDKSDTGAIGKAIKQAGSIIFSSPINFQKGAEKGSLASVRTSHRSKRKLFHRKRVRKFELLAELIKLKMVPLSEDELLLAKKKQSLTFKENSQYVNWLKLDFNNDGKPDFISPYQVNTNVKLLLGKNFEDTLASPYQLRATAIENPELITLEMLGRIAYHFIQRRGYLSNRKEKGKLESKKNDEFDTSEQNKMSVHTETSLKLSKNNRKNDEIQESDVEAKAEETKKVLEAILSYDKLLEVKNLTPGQEIAQRLVSHLTSDGSPERARNRNKGVNKFSRPTLKMEWAEIVKRYRETNECTIEDNAWVILEDIIFRNRPLKSQKRNIGKCLLEPNKFKMPISHPVFEYFRIWQVINNIRYGFSYAEINKELDIFQKNKLVKEMLVVSNFEADALKRKIAIVLNVNLKQTDIFINYNKGETISGSPFLTNSLKSLGEERFEAMYQLGLERLSLEEQQTNSKGVASTPEWIELKSKRLDLFQLWQWVFEAETDEDYVALVDRLLDLQLEERNVKSLWNSIKDGYSSLSLRAALNILRFMERGFRYDTATLYAKVPKIVGYQNFYSNSELIIKQLSDTLADNVFTNKAIGVANEWFFNYNNSIDSKSEIYKPFRMEPTALDVEIKESLISIVKRDLARLNEDDQRKVLNKAEHLVSEKIKLGTRHQLVTDGKPAIGQSIYTFGLYSKVTNKQAIENYLTDNHSVSEKLAKALYHHSDTEIKFLNLANQSENELPSPITNSLKNPVVLRTLNQLRRLINYLIRNNSIEPSTTAIQIEMSRDLNSANMRKAILIYQKKQEEENENAKKEIKKYFDSQGQTWIESGTDVRKYRLWKDQNEICIYTGKKISLAQLLNGIDFDIEHTIPQSRYPDSEMENLTICDSNYNRNVKGNTFPADLPNFQEIEKRISCFERQIENKQEKLNKLKGSIKGASTKESKDKAIVAKNVLLMEKQYWVEKLKCFTTPESKFKGGFRKRQALDTAMINKYAIRFLKQKFEMVKGSKGSATDLIREAWGLKGDNGKKDRSFHTHHAEDAIIQTLLFNTGGQKGAYKLISELSRGNGVLYDQFKNRFDNNQSHKITADTMTSILRSKEFTPFGLHYTKIRAQIIGILDNVIPYHASVRSPLKQTKKKLRDSQGRVMYSKDSSGAFVLDSFGNKVPLYQKGFGIRAELHMGTWYGKIIDPNNKQEICRTSISVADLVTKEKDRREDIVDSKLKSIAKALPKEYFTDAKKGEFYLELPPSDEQLAINPNAQPQRVFKVKVQESVKNPLKIKMHENPLGINLSKTQPVHKRFLYAQKAENIMMVQIELKKKGKVISDLLPIASDMLAASPKSTLHELLSSFEMVSALGEFLIKQKYSKGDVVAFYENSPEEIDWSNRKELKNRLFIVEGFVGDFRKTGKDKQTPQIQCKRIDCALDNKGIIAYYTDLFKTPNFENTWKTGRSSFVLAEKPLKLNVSIKGLKCILLEGNNYNLNPDGTIEIK